MRVIGVAAKGRQVFDRRLEHGVDPRVLAYEAGWVVLRPVESDLDEDGEIRLVLRVRHRRKGDGHPRTRKPGRDRGLKLSTDEPPVVRQRFAAYAVVESTRGLLGALFSQRVRLADPVERAMEEPLPTLGATEPVSRAIELLVDGDALLVLDDGRPAGVLTRQDLLSDVG
jgi:CBS domain-containing protein